MGVDRLHYRRFPPTVIDMDEGKWKDFETKSLQNTCSRATKDQFSPARFPPEVQMPTLLRVKELAISSQVRAERAVTLTFKEDGSSWVIQTR